MRVGHFRFSTQPVGLLVLAPSFEFDGAAFPSQNGNWRVPLSPWKLAGLGLRFRTV